MRVESTTRLTSKFDTFGTIGTTAATLICIGLLTFMTYVWVYDLEDIGMFQRIMITFFPLLVMPLLLRVEMPKIKKIEIDEDGLTLINPFIGTKRKLLWDNLDGYKTMTHVTRGGLVNELIIISNGTEIFDISSHYYKNYNEIRKLVTRNLSNVGQKDFKYWDYFKKRVFK
jgi:hypothetical protein